MCPGWGIQGTSETDRRQGKPCEDYAFAKDGSAAAALRSATGPDAASSKVDDAAQKMIKMDQGRRSSIENSAVNMAGVITLATLQDIWFMLR